MTAKNEHAIDLRSDTVTRPTVAMREAMFHAEVGDDVLGEDPTVNRLEAEAARLFGKESAVFGCSGTQCNQMAVRAHCRPGDELLIHHTGHIAMFEAGGPAALSGVTVRTFEGDRGMLDTDVLDQHPRSADQHFCRTRLLCLENTTNLGGGAVYPLERIRELSEWARRNDLRIHLDGARLMNAVVASGYTLPEIAEFCDTISLCFSKGLGCPMGSVLVGSADDIAVARRARKLFGGGLRQAGFAAAAALYALDNHVERLNQDHQNARRLAQRLNDIEGICVRPEETETNLVYFNIDPDFGTAFQLTAALKNRGILVIPMGGQRIRAVTHLDVGVDDIENAADAVRECLNSGIQAAEGTSVGPYVR